MEVMANPLLAGTPNTLTDQVRAWAVDPERKYEDVFPIAVTQSEFLAACKDIKVGLLDNCARRSPDKHRLLNPILQGVSFYADKPEAYRDEPQGHIVYTKDPTWIHDHVACCFDNRFREGLEGIGLILDEDFFQGGSGRCLYGGGSFREPDGLWNLAANPDPDGPPGLVVEVARAQRLDNLLDRIEKWVEPGGGRASLAIGIDISKPGNKLLLSAYMATPPAHGAATATVSPPQHFGENITSCRRQGDARFFLWVPLAPLVRHRYSSWYITWLGVRQAIGGFIYGTLAFCNRWPWTAIASARARMMAPWCAVPIDLYRLKRMACRFKAEVK